jgi:hypothetical protein
MFNAFHKKLAMLFCAVLWLVSGSLASGQTVGSRDLTKELPAPQAGAKSGSTSYEHDFCFPSGGNADGVIVSDDPVLTLSISKSELVIVNQKPSIDLTITLKNHGVDPALIPWSVSPVEPSQLSEANDMKTVGYEVATIDFFLGPPHTEDRILGLRTHIALWSQPENPAQSIRVRAGESVELKARTEIVCRLADSTQCVARLRASKLQVSAWWYQRLLSTTLKGSCIYQTGAYTQHELDSNTVDVGSTPLQESQKVELPPISGSNPR